MDKKEKSRRKRIINSLVARGIKHSGFIKTKDNFFVSVEDRLAKFMHLHFYSSTNNIRIHLGVRALADPNDSIALNGPSFDGWREEHINPITEKKYEFGYNIIEHKEDASAEEIITFFREVALPYFEDEERNGWSILHPVYLDMLKKDPDLSETSITRKLLKLKSA